MIESIVLVTALVGVWYAGYITANIETKVNQLNKQAEDE